jgi:triosephosphate isomerase (TIM)
MNKPRQFLIAGNWKMHGTRASVGDLLAQLKHNFVENSAAELVVFPPYVFLEQAERILDDTAIEWGAQNVALENKGAFTGEVAAEMLCEFGCRYVLVGHSERRQLYGESNELVAQKFIAAQRAGMQPILCVGETLEQRKQGLTEKVVTEQLSAVLQMLEDINLLEKAVLAYEPVWAIGTGLTATPEQAQAVHAVLRQQLVMHSASIAQQLRILYGGSLKAANAAALFVMPDIDGGLIGGASLDASEFLQIYQHALSVIPKK